MSHRPHKQLSLYIGLGLAVATLAVYWRVLQHPFINYDDPAYVTANPMVSAGLTLRGLRWAFTSYDASNWHPLTWLSHMLDCHLFGLNAGAHHMVNVLFHTCNAVLLFAVLQRMTRATWRSAFVAGMFALHPLHVESVAWVSERKDVLCAMFWMLTLGAYARYAQGEVQGSAFKVLNSRNWYALTLLCFVLGVMSKPMLVTLPFVLLLLDVWPLQRAWPNFGGPGSVPAAGTTQRSSLQFGYARAKWCALLLEKLPLFLLAAASCWVTLLAQRSAVAPLAEVPFPARVANAAVACMHYIEKTILPVNLSVFYPLHPDGPLWPAWVAVAVLACISIVALCNLKRRPWLIVGWFWFLGTLLPVIGLVQVGGQSMADRYTYIPMIGLSIMAAWSVPPRITTGRAGRRTITVAAALLLLIWGILSIVQLGYWKDGETLFRHALAVTTGNDLAHKNLGNILRQQGKLEEAIAQYQHALRVNPDYAAARVSLGSALGQAGRVQEAADQYEQALRLDPGNVEAHNNLGNICFRSDRFEEAIRHYEQALQASPDNAEVHKNLGASLQRIGRTEEAIQHYQLAIANAAGQGPLVTELEGRIDRCRRSLQQPGIP